MLSRPRPNEAFGITQGKLTTLSPSGPYVRQGMSSCPDQKINDLYEKLEPKPSQKSVLRRLSGANIAYIFGPSHWITVNFNPSQV